MLNKLIARKTLLAPLAVLVLAACSDEGSTGAYVGYVEGEYVYVTAPQSGWVEELSVREGDRVARGELLVSLDTDQQSAMLEEATAAMLAARASARNLETGARPDEIEALVAELADAEARLVLAKADLERIIPLVERGAVSAARGDAVEAAYDSAKARVAGAREAIDVARLGGRDAEQEAARASAASAEAAVAQVAWTLSQRNIESRVDGQVEELFHRKGEFVTMGSSVVSILPDDALKIRFFVPQSDLPSMQLGEEVSVSADGLAAPVSANISFVAREAEFTPPVIYSADVRDKLVFLVEARLPAGTDIRPGLPVDVSLP